MTHTPEELAMARRCLSEAYGIDTSAWMPAAQLAVLLAIQATTEAAAKHLEARAEEAGGYGDLGFAARIDAKRLRDGAHLKGNPHDRI